MSQALHIFKKDLRRGWPLLLLWAAVLVYCIAPVWIARMRGHAVIDGDDQ